MFMDWTGRNAAMCWLCGCDVVEVALIQRGRRRICEDCVELELD
jgi:hypothetical protein